MQKDEILTILQKGEKHNENTWNDFQCLQPYLSLKT